MPRIKKMADAIRIFFGYQNPAFSFLLNWVITHHILMESATGSGKTTYGIGLMKMMVGEGKPFTHGLIVTPQHVISDGFIPEFELVLKHSDHEIVARPEDFCRPGKHESATQAALDYFAKPSPNQTLVLTHSAFIRLTKSENCPTDFGKTLVFFDEAHHMAARASSLAVNKLVVGGARFVLATATAFRTDKAFVGLPDMKIYRRSLPEQMQDRFAPTTLEHRNIALGEAGDAVTDKAFYGEEMDLTDAEQWKVIRILVDFWINEGMPKCIFRVPIMRGGSIAFATKLTEALQQAMELKGKAFRIINAAGEAHEIQTQLIAEMKKERVRSFKKSEVAAIVGIQRVLEGLDWKHCSTLNCIGMPRSIQQAVQLIGRTSRKKGDGYDIAYKHRMVANFFVPCAGGHGDALNKEHVIRAMMLSCYVVDQNLAGKLLLTKVARKANGGEEDLDLFPMTPGIERLSIDDEMMVKAFIISEIHAKTHNELNELVVAATRKFPALAPEELGRCVVEMAANDPDNHEAIVPHVTRYFKLVKRSRLTLSGAGDAFVADFLEKFRGMTLMEMPAYVEVADQTLALTGQSMGECFGSMGGGEYVSDEYAIQEAKKYYSENGDYPHSGTDSLIGTTNVTWKNFAIRLLRRNPITTLKDLLQNLPNYVAKTILLSEDKIKSLAWDFFEKKHHPPNNRSGEIIRGKQWSSVFRDFRKLGFSRCDVLIKWGFEDFAKTHYRWDLNEIGKFLNEFWKVHRRLPLSRDKKIAKHLGSWGQFIERIKQTEHQTLSQFAIKFCPDYKPIGSIDRQWIVNQANEFFAINGSWPVTKSAGINGDKYFWLRIARKIRHNTEYAGLQPYLLVNCENYKPSKYGPKSYKRKSG